MFIGVFILVWVEIVRKRRCLRNNAAEEEMAHEDQKAINDHTDLNIIEGDSGNVVFSTVDNEAETWLHKNYLKRSPNETSEEEINPLLNNNYMRQIRN